MADGNRRSNYDGCLLPPVFIGPGDPYDKHFGHSLRDFYAGKRIGGMKAGQKPPSLGNWWHKRGATGGGDGGALRDAGGPPVGGLDRSGPGFKAGGRSASNPLGLFSFECDTTPCGDESAPPPGGGDDGPKRGAFTGPGMRNMGRGAGGVFSSAGYVSDPFGDGSAPARGGDGSGLPRGGDGGRPWLVTNPQSRRFNANPGYLVPGTAADGQLYDMSKYRTSTAPARGTFRDTNATVKGTLSRFPPHVKDPYGEEHVGYTLPGRFRGRIRRPFVTYKNITRTAAQDKSLK